MALATRQSTAELSTARPPGSPPEVLDNTLRVTTPENISFQYQLAGPFRRIIAYLIDVLVSIVGFFAVAGVVFLLSILLAPLAASLGLSRWIEGLMGLLMGMILVCYFIVYWFYGALMETYFNGQTLGKRWTNMRVLTSDGHSIDGVQATLRNFFRLLDIFPVVPFSAIFQTEDPISLGLPSCLFGLIMMTFSKKFQRVGDMVAGTVVVNEDSSRAPGLIVFTDSRVPQLAELIPPSFVATPSMSKAIANYADQRRFLHHQRASEIASYVAAPLLEQFGLMQDTDHDLFLCALYYKTFVASANGTEMQANEEPEIITPGGQAIPQGPQYFPGADGGPEVNSAVLGQVETDSAADELPTAVLAEEKL